MKKITVSVSYEEEKLSALKLYLAQRGTQLETELTKSLDTLYAKNVPTGVREFIDLRSGNQEPPVQKPKKPKTESKPEHILSEVTKHER